MDLGIRTRIAGFVCGNLATQRRTVKPNDAVHGNIAGEILYSRKFRDWVSGCCSVTTVKCVRLAIPKEVVMATSEASRPAAIRTRPMRGWLLRASKAHHRFSR